MSGGHPPDEFYIYIAGDSNRTVQISYLGREMVKNTSRDRPFDGSPPPEYVGGKKNVIITESVTLPFFKEVYCVGGSKSEGAFLEVVSENDSTTRAIIFNISLSLEDSCGVFSVWFPENAVGRCSYCKDLPKDSVLTSLKRMDYPCYLEFSKGDTRKKVMMRDYWAW
jgi:hypothetical protein